MTEPQPTHIVTRQVGLAVRAPRVAVLIRQDADWATCIALVQTLTETWGGATFAIIPTDGRRIESVFWRLLRRHDPDWFVQFGDLEVSSELEHCIFKHFSIALPLHDHVERIWPRNTGYPLVSVSTAIQDGLSVGKVIIPTIEADPVSQILLYSSTGCLSLEERDELKDRNVELEVQVVVPTLNGLLGIASGLWAPSPGTLNPLYPVNLSHLGLGTHATRASLRRAPLVLICGDSVRDFCYFWTLRTLTGLPQNGFVHWIPRIAPDPDTAPEAAAMWRVQAQAVSRIRMRDHKRDLIASSLSLQETALSSLGTRMASDCLFGSWESSRGEVTTSITWIPSDRVADLAPHRVQIWDMENPSFANQTVVQFIGETPSAPLMTPMLHGISMAYESRTHWMVDVLVVLQRRALW